MSFLAPWMLLGALGASVPIILHFFYRTRYRPVPWAAMEFLRTSIEQTSRRLKFQEWILLILRTLALLLLAIALARPATQMIGSGGRGESVDAILMIDNSMSMGARDGNKTRFERAKEAALSLIDDLPANSTVQIITCSDRAAYVGPRSPSNLDQARQLIAKLEVSQQATDFFPGFSAAMEAFNRCQGDHREIYLFSDMQKIGWERQLSGLRTICSEIKNQANLVLVRCTTRPIKNVSITGINLQTGIPHTNTRTPFTVFLRNGGTEAVTNLSLSLEVNGKPLEKDARAIEIIGAGETKAITLTGKLEQAGWVTLTARVQTDDLDLDNRFDRMISVREQVKVLVIDGTPNDRDQQQSGSYFLGHALIPVADALKSSYHIQPRIIRPHEASASLLSDYDICILANVSMDSSSITLNFVKRLSEWVRDGHGLLISSGDRVDPKVYNELLGPKPTGVDLLPCVLDKVVTLSREKPVLMNLSSIDQTSFLGRFREFPLNQIAKVETNAYIATHEIPKAEGESIDPTRVMMRYADSQPAVLSRQVGDGEVIMVTTSFDLSWTLLPVYPQAAFEPFIHAALTHLVQRSASLYNRVVGDQIQWTPPDGYRNYTLALPSQELLPLGKPKGGIGGQAFFISIPDTSRAGIYRIIPDGDEKTVSFAVVPDLRETENLDVSTDNEIQEGLGIKPIFLTTGLSEPISYSAVREKNEWTTTALLILFFLAIGEMVWAWVCGRAW